MMKPEQAASLLRRFQYAKGQEKWQRARDLIMLLSHDLPNGIEISFASSEPSSTDGVDAQGR